MILTACPNTALDIILFVDEWTPGIPVRTNRVVHCVGGKGLDSSVVLSQLGVHTTAIACFAGFMGKQLLDIVNEYGIKIEPVWVDGESRVSYVVAEAKNKRHTHIIAGEMEITREHRDIFIDKFIQHLYQADMVIMAGSLPTSMDVDFYALLVSAANQAGVPCLIDSQKASMRTAINEKPFIVKMNWEEFEWTFGCKANNLDELIHKASEVKKIHAIRNMVLTLSKEGILALTEDGEFLAKAPLQEPVNAAGAGDAVSAALGWRLSLKEDWDVALRWAAAISAAAVLTERTGDVHIEDVQHIFPLVTIDKLN